MIPLTTLVQQTTYEITPASSRLPPFLWTGFAALNKVHSLWRWYRRVEVYSNPNNFAQLLAGHAVNFIIGDIVVVRIAAQCLLISTRLLECVQQQAALCQAGRAWKDAILGHYPQPVRCSWDASWKVAGCVLWNRIQRIALCSLNLFEHTFRLSMRIMDAIDAFCLSPYTRNEGVNEGFVNAMKWMDTIVENKEKLLRGVVDNQIIIERILRGSPLTYNQVRDGVAKTLEKTETVHRQAKKISAFGNGVLIEAGKRMVDEMMVALGFARLRPSWLV